jgi:type II secretory pathway pseudopilin PulG
MKFSCYLSHRRSPRHRQQGGYILLALLLAVALLMIALTVEAPRIAQQIQRDREEELIHRGREYQKAIRRFYLKFGNFPSSLDQLENTNNLRFLRKRYPDPITGKDDWRLIHMGEAKISIKGLPAAPGGKEGTPASSLTDKSEGESQVGTPASQLSKPLGGKSFGGGPIVGVASSSEKESIKELDGKNHYNEWEFVYDPRMDQGSQIPGQAGATGQSGTGTATPTGPATPPNNPQ